MDIELRQLRILTAVAEAGGLSGAAVALGMSQAKLDQQIQRLERMVGAALLHDSPAGTTFTEAGEVLLEHAAVVLPQFDRMLAAARAGAEAPAPGVVRIGAVATPILPGLVHAIDEAVPGAELSVRIEEPGTDLAEALLRDELDLAVLRQHPATGAALPPSLACSPVATEPLFVGIPPGHALGTPVSIAPAALSGHRCVLLDQAVQPLTLAVLVAFADAGADPRFCYAASEWAALCLGSGTGILTVTTPPTTPMPGTAYRPVRCAAAMSALVLAWVPGGPVTDCAARIHEAAMEAHADCLRALATEP